MVQTAQAQDVPQDEEQEQTAPAEAALPPVSEEEMEAVVDPIDQLLTDWLRDQVRPNLDRDAMNIYGYDTTEVPTVSDSVLMERLAALETPIPMDFNKNVRAFIDLYTLKRREKVEVMLGLSNYYFPMFEEVLDRHGLPLEFRYMPVIESALSPNAVSPAGATGIWQFMYSTGRFYDLDITSYVDERRDPYAASEAAAHFLSDLHNIFGDWLMVIAAYNCGPGNVNRAIRRSGGKKEFWEIYPYLPRETRGYVPAFIAATYAFNYHKEHNLFPKKVELPMAVDTVMVQEELPFENVAAVLNVDMESLRLLNPQYKRDVVPVRSKPYVLRLPVHQTFLFCTYEDSIYCWGQVKEEELIAATEDGNEQQAASVSTTELLRYTVKPGDNLGYIAEWYSVSAMDLRSWNDIRGNLIRPGQRLRVYVPSGHKGRYEHMNELSFSEKQQLARGSTTTVSSGLIHYTVRQGDTLWEIARRHPGVSVDDIRALNNMRSSSLKPGQKIKIQVGS